MLRLPAYSYAVPTSVAEAARLLHDHGNDAMVVAGGTDVIPNLKRRQFHPKVLVGLHQVLELKGIQVRDGALAVGALTTLAEVAEHPEVQRCFPALAKAIRSIGTPQLQNQGTIGGNLCLNTRCNYYNQLEDWREALGSCMKAEGTFCQVAPKSPRCWAVSSSDTAPVLVAIGAKVRLASHAGEREIPVGELYRDDGINYLSSQKGEILTEVVLPPSGTWDRTAYLKLRRRESFDFPILGVAAAVRFGEGGVVEQLSVVLGAVASAPLALPEAQALFQGKRLDDAEAIAALQAVATKRATPMDNADAGYAWRKRMVKVYVARALKEMAQ